MQFGKAAADFLQQDFYVDDGLKSFATPKDAIDVINKTKIMCSAAFLRVHKFASNSKAVLDALPAEDRAKDLKDLDLCLDVLPVQCSLGTYWCIKTDTIGFRIELKDKLLTRRGNSFNRELSVRPTRHSSSSYLSGKTTTSRTMP